MKFKHSKPTENIRVLMQRAGYATHMGRGGLSYTRRLGGGNYPRFHVYSAEAGEVIEIDIHLDQKQPSYEGFHAHAGEYDGPLVERELERIKAFL